MKVPGKEFHVYIIANLVRTVLYTGVTNNLPQRLIEHYLSRKDIKTFTGRYNCHLLLYYESFRYITNAIAREKEIKSWSRKKEGRIDHRIQSIMAIIKS